jgi:hypothetical protein
VDSMDDVMMWRVLCCRQNPYLIGAPSGKGTIHVCISVPIFYTEHTTILNTKTINE